MNPRLVNVEFLKKFHDKLAEEEEERLSVVKNSTVPRDLSSFATIPAAIDNKSAFAYVESGGNPYKISLKEIVSKTISTVTEVPDEMQPGQYIFLEKREE